MAIIHSCMGCLLMGFVSRTCSERLASKPTTNRDYWFWPVTYHCQPHGFKTRLVGRVFYTFVRNVLFSSPTDVRSHKFESETL